MGICLQIERFNPFITSVSMILAYPYMNQFHMHQQPDAKHDTYIFTGCCHLENPMFGGMEGIRGRRIYSRVKI